jgi:hypothetical protein
MNLALMMVEELLSKAAVTRQPADPANEKLNYSQFFKTKDGV